MNMTKKILAMAVLAASMSVSASAAMQAQGQCKLKNLAADKVLYHGACTIRQSESGKNTVYEIKMGAGESFLFAGHGSQWMHGADKVKFTDLGGGAIFVWDKFSLSAVAR
ncbi:MAG: hypothetical protein DSZ05_05900 [Sulfurospirillum sp.]|nr:MAG: hypothetical protein DSZ05_05900 [Sulfurospirillum sp.]